VTSSESINFLATGPGERDLLGLRFQFADLSHLHCRDEDGLIR